MNGYVRIKDSSQIETPSAGGLAIEAHDLSVQPMVRNLKNDR